MIRVLFLAANPVDQAHLRLRQEFDELRRALDERGTGQTVCVDPRICRSGRPVTGIALPPPTAIDSVVGIRDTVTDEAALNFAPAFFRALADGQTLSGSAFDLGRNQLDLQNLGEADNPHLLAERIDARQARALDWDDDRANNHDNQSARHLWAISFNQNFFGRDEELATLHSLLQAQTHVAICPVITGMGGLGKTQLAAHYARDHVDDYPAGIFWITAADLNEIRPQLADFCVALGLPVADPQRSGDLSEQKITAFKRYLEDHPCALLIFDNAAEPDHLRTRQITVQLTALTLGGKVIVTTRRRKLPDDKFAELALQRLLPEPARQILLAARADLAGDPDLDPLCAQFGYLPLMLNLAATALKKRRGNCRLFATAANLGCREAAQRSCQSQP